MALTIKAPEADHLSRNPAFRRRRDDNAGSHHRSAIASTPLRKSEVVSKKRERTRVKA